MDGFHLSNAALDRLGRRDRKGAIDTFDAAGYVATLHRVAEECGRRDVYVPAFDRRLDEPVAAGHVVPADSRLVVTEGNYLGVPDGDWAQVRPLLNRLYYVDCPAPVRRARLVHRHVEGGRTPQAAARGPIPSTNPMPGSSPRRGNFATVCRLRRWSNAPRVTQARSAWRIPPWRYCRRPASSSAGSGWRPRCGGASASTAPR